MDGTYLDFGSEGNLTVVTAEDLTNYIFEGDTVILLRHNENDDLINPIAQPSFVSYVESVGRRSLVMNTTIAPHNLDVTGENPHRQAVYVSDWNNVDVYVGTTPDHPGTIKIFIFFLSFLLVRVLTFFSPFFSFLLLQPRHDWFQIGRPLCN